MKANVNRIEEIDQECTNLFAALHYKVISEDEYESSIYNLKLELMYLE